MLKVTLLNQIDALRDIYERLPDKRMTIKSRNALAKLRKNELEIVFQNIKKVLEDKKLLKPIPEPVDTIFMDPPQLSDIDEEDNEAESSDYDSESDSGYNEPEQHPNTPIQIKKKKKSFFNSKYLMVGGGVIGLMLFTYITEKRRLAKKINE